MATKKRTSTKTLTTSRTTESKTVAPSQGGGVTEDQIRVRAYYLSLERNGRPADPVVDWVRAEQELTVERSTGA